MNKQSRIYVAGHQGLVGAAVMRVLSVSGFKHVIRRTHSELDLCEQSAVDRFFRDERPEYVVLAAARVGGILANATYQADFIYQNLAITTNVIHAAWRTGTKKLINLGSSCIYPRLAPQPLKEEYLLTGPLEPTNEPYAVAKIAGIKLCRYYNEQYNTNFISLMPTNVFGPEDNFDVQSGHVLAALIRKLHHGAEQLHSGEKDVTVTLWGDGTPRREFLYVDDLADAILFVLDNLDECDIGEFVNVGTGTDLTIEELARTVATIVGYSGPIKWDTSFPNGTPRKVLDTSRIHALGWKTKTGLIDGIRKTYTWFRANYDVAKGVRPS